MKHQHQYGRTLPSLHETRKDTTRAFGLRLKAAKENPLELTLKGETLAEKLEAYDALCREASLRACMAILPPRREG